MWYCMLESGCWCTYVTRSHKVVLQSHHAVPSISLRWDPPGWKWSRCLQKHVLCLLHFLSLHCWYYQHLYDFCMTDAYKHQNKIIFQGRGVPICFAFDESDLIFAHFWALVTARNTVCIATHRIPIWTGNFRDPDDVTFETKYSSITAHKRSKSEGGFLSEISLFGYAIFDWTRLANRKPEVVQ